MRVFKYGEEQLNSSLAIGIAKGEVIGELTDATRGLIDQSAKRVQNIVDAGQVVYGINTGFGPLCTTRIDAKETATLQENILKSHAVGVGELIDIELSKLMLILKVQALSKGFSGIQLDTIDRIMWHIQEDVIPAVPKQGSV